MPAEIDDYDEQIKELINKIQSALENDLPNLKGNERNEVRRPTPAAPARTGRGALRNAHPRARRLLSLSLSRGGLQKIKYLKGRIDRLRQVFHSFKVELRELPKIESRRYDDVRRAVRLQEAVAAGSRRSRAGCSFFDMPVASGHGSTRSKLPTSRRTWTARRSLRSKSTS